MFDIKEDYKIWKKVVYKNGRAFSNGSNPKEQYINYLNDCNCMKPEYFTRLVCEDMKTSKYIYRELVMGCIETYRYFQYTYSKYSNEELCDMAVEALKKLGKTERSAWGDKPAQTVSINSKHNTFRNKPV